MFDIVQSCFTIELMVAAYLCAGHLRMRRKTKAYILPLAVLLTLVTAYKIGGRSLIDYGYAGGLTHYLAVLLLVSGLVWLSFDTAMSEALLYGAAAYAMQHCGHDFVMLVLQLLELNSAAVYLTPLYACVRVSVMGIVYLILYRFFARDFKPDREKIQSGRRWVILSAALLGLVTALYGVLDRSGIEGFGVIMMHIYDAISTIFGMTLLMFAARNDKLTQELNTIRQMWQMQQEHYELSKENIQLINIKCHDIRRHITSLYARESGEKAKDSFIKEVERSIRIYDLIANTGNESLDVILTEKSLFCEKHHIRMTCMADGKCLGFMEEVDLYSLFGNILDNAIESVQKIADTDKRVISLDVRASGMFMRIQEENYFGGSLRFADGLPVTTKENRDHHGFGMKSIRMIVDKYGGEMQIDAQDGVFSLNILIPIRDRGDHSQSSAAPDTDEINRVKEERCQGA